LKDTVLLILIPWKRQASG